MATLPGCDVIGSGYDVLNGYYADARSCLDSLFEFGGDSETVVVGDKSFTKPKVITYHSSIETFEYTAEGKSISEYNRSINSKTKLEGEYNFFSASVELDIGKSSAENLEKSFSKVQENVNLFTLQLPADHSELVKPMVQKEIDEMTDLTKLFDKYGTHYVSGILMGGSATYTASTNKTSFQSKFSLGLVAKMSYKSLVGSLTAEEQAQYSEDIKLFNEASTTTLQAKGGDPTYGGADFPQHTKEWRTSVKDYLSFMDFLGNHGLVGIWNLASSDARSKQIEGSYADYCKKEQTKFDLDPPYIRAKIVPLTKVQFTDKGSHADKDLSVCIPDIGSDWHYLGQVAFPGGDRASGNTLVVQDIKAGALVKVKSWEKVWDDHGSGRPKDFNLWRGVSGNPVDYHVLSDFFRGGVDDQNAPTQAESKGIVAVHSSCLVQADVGDMVWNDAGTHADDDASVWKIIPKDPNSIDMSKIQPYYVSTNSHSKPLRPVYLLKKSAVHFVD